MSVRYFSPDEANALLPDLEPLMGDLLARRAKAARMRRDVAMLLDTPHVDLGGRRVTELTQEFIGIEQLVQQIRGMGCVIKSLEAGLVDFLAQLDGRDVYLCWRYGEDRVSHYHELHTGFRDRRKLE